MGDDAELDRLVRDGLQRRAGDADTTVPVAPRAVAAVRRRRHRGRLAAGLAAASVAAVVVVVAVGSTPPPPPDPDELPRPADVEPREWRTEYWAGIRVDVPADWAWGGSPRKGPRPVACSEVPAERPYVGRPVTQTDVCSVTTGGVLPRAPYVWLDSPTEPGVVDLGDGWVQETVESGGTRIAIVTDDDALRARIRGSVGEQDTCSARLDEPPRGRFDLTTEGPGTPRTATLCAYQRRGGPLVLVYATVLDAGQVEDTFAAVMRAPASSRRCKATGEVVHLSIDASDPYAGDPDRVQLHQDVIVDLTCSQVRLGPGALQELTPASVAPWAIGGVSETLTGPSAGWAYDHFLGMQG